jgi:biotin operon repressor
MAATFPELTFHPSLNQDEYFDTDTRLIAAALATIPNSPGFEQHYDDWFKVMCALHLEASQNPKQTAQLQELADKWSMQAEKYNRRTQRKTWKSIKDASGKKLTSIATVFGLAKGYGWRQIIAEREIWDADHPARIARAKELAEETSRWTAMSWEEFCAAMSMDPITLQHGLGPDPLYKPKTPQPNKEQPIGDGDGVCTAGLDGDVETLPPPVIDNLNADPDDPGSDPGSNPGSERDSDPGSDDLDKLNISDDLRHAIQSGCYIKGHPKADDTAWWIVCHLSAAGISAETILCIITDARFRASNHWAKYSRDWIAGQIAIAVQTVKDNPDAGDWPRNKPPPNGKKPVVIKTFAQLQRMTFKEPKVLVPGLITEGCYLLAARPKIGKSWMTLNIGLAVAMGTTCLSGSKQCEQGDVLYLALEDGEKRLQRRGSKLLPTFNGTWPANFHYATDWPRGDECLIEIERWIIAHPNARLVVIDILAKVRVPSSAKLSAYEQDYNALSGFQKLAQKYSITIIVVHHTRKSAGVDMGDEISGTQGIGGAVDAYIVIKTTTKGKIMQTTGRDIDESELLVQFDHETCQWEILGNPDAVLASETRKAVMEVLTHADAPMGPTEIASATGIERTTVSQMLYRLGEDGVVVKRGRGKYELKRSQSTGSGDGWETGF